MKKQSYIDKTYPGPKGSTQRTENINTLLIVGIVAFYFMVVIGGRVFADYREAPAAPDDVAEAIHISNSNTITQCRALDPNFPDLGFVYPEIWIGRRLSEGQPVSRKDVSAMKNSLAHCRTVLEFAADRAAAKG